MDAVLGIWAALITRELVYILSRNVNGPDTSCASLPHGTENALVTAS